MNKIKEIISNKEYDEFVETGKVLESRLLNLALKVMKGEKEFSIRETAIFSAKTTRINQLIKLLSGNK
jgi:hypothetical protein